MSKSSPPRGVVQCKLGTIPGLKVIHRQSVMEVGSVIRVRSPGPGTSWMRVEVLQLDPLLVKRYP